MFIIGCIVGFLVGCLFCAVAFKWATRVDDEPPTITSEGWGMAYATEEEKRAHRALYGFTQTGQTPPRYQKRDGDAEPQGGRTK